MQKESVKYFSAKRIISYLMILILIPATLILFWHFGDRKYYLCSLLLIIYSMIPFFLSFEQRKPQARELVSIAVMCAIAVVSRAAFMMLPHFKPMLGIIMITGMAFGAEAGFLTGALGAFVSNFLFGQGPWTPWQMFGYGIGGLLAGLLARKGIMTEKKRVRTAVIGFLIILCIVGPILDTCTVFTMNSVITAASAGAIYLSGLPVNIVHGTATALTLLILCKPLMEKLERIRIKYGMMGEDEDEI